MVARDRDPKTGLLDLLVYYEVLLGNREVKRKSKNFRRINMALQYNKQKLRIIYLF
jgi:hypothetical protein